MRSLVYGAGVRGRAGMAAAIENSPAFAWGLGEVTEYRRSLKYRAFEARWFCRVHAVRVSAEEARRDGLARPGLADGR